MCVGFTQVVLHFAELAGHIAGACYVSNVFRFAYIKNKLQMHACFQYVMVNDQDCLHTAVLTCISTGREHSVLFRIHVEQASGSQLLVEMSCALSVSHLQDICKPPTTL